jgi:hypothetical protein
MMIFVPAEFRDVPSVEMAASDPLEYQTAQECGLNHDA